MDNVTDANSLNDAPPALLAQIYADVVRSMTAALPLPRPFSPQALAARDINAISQVAGLVPANAAESMMAVHFVVANAHALACHAVEPGTEPADPDTARHAATHGARMFRIAQGAANVLLRLQAARQRREATPESASSALMTEHCLRQLMLQALKDQAAARAEAEREANARAEAEAAQQALPPPEPEPDPEPPPITDADIEAAEAYAQSNRANLNRARIMRRKRGFPNWGMFTPPEDHVVRAIAFGHSPFLDALLPPGG